MLLDRGMIKGNVELTHKCHRQSKFKQGGIRCLVCRNRIEKIIRPTFCKREGMMERLFCVKNVMKKQCKNLGHQPVEVFFLHCIKSILKTAGYSTAIAARAPPCYAFSLFCAIWPLSVLYQAIAALNSLAGYLFSSAKQTLHVLLS